MERMLVSEYIACHADDDQRQKAVEGLACLYALEIMRKCNLAASVNVDLFFESLLATECIDHGEHVSLAVDWEKDRIYQMVGGRQ